MSFCRITVTAAMLGVYYVAAVQRLNVMCASKLLCMELQGGPKN